MNLMILISKGNSAAAHKIIMTMLIQERGMRDEDEEGSPKSLRDRMENRSGTRAPKVCFAPFQD